MGGSVSTNVPEISEKVSAKTTDIEAEIMRFVVPIYYTDAPITSKEMEEATKVWKLITNSKSEVFLKLKRETAGFEYENCVEYFFHLLYTRLFDIHPHCRGLFHRPINKQGSFMLRFISMCLTDWEDEDKWNKTFLQFANIHNKMGVKSVECKILYIIVYLIISLLIVAYVIFRWYYG
jgi:hypothetical protein